MIGKMKIRDDEMMRRNVSGAKVLSETILELPGSVFTQPNNLLPSRKHVPRPCL